MLKFLEAEEKFLLKDSSGQEVFIRISVMNARGQSNWSTVVSFISRTGVNPPSPSPNPHPLPPAV
ncbi:MAG: hypothetical protein HY063_00670 [Bacteroidetes bacterium]|nr:hypothetical protein [Bacteroidota bacterium]